MNESFASLSSEILAEAMGNCIKRASVLLYCVPLVHRPILFLHSTYHQDKRRDPWGSQERDIDPGK
ncbi:hypothetical protein DM01DRAFT_1332028 [Hesseltinella vesiculosa]|uniref:Uncharacterized protein n=1 Tax=Hesseltinella vesiculosa TaxID=101127 RepID=A0A1X2GV49_9FUNG|nr:hypothetical protein DM01DRAFT_1332028 [Hesseltinella vesiculosa]